MSKNKNIFRDVASPQVPKSVQDLSHQFKFSCNMGELVPVATIDCLPGTRLHLDNEALVRMLPLITPPFDRFNVTFHRWFVPKRLLWEHWDEYVSLTKIGSPAALPVHPFITVAAADMDPATLASFGRLFNYMGVPFRYEPVIQTEALTINPMRFSAYQFIINENYRDQNLIPEIDYKLVDGDNSSRNAIFGTLRLRAWNHDYFTSGLPFTQKGDSVLMPFSFGDVPVKIESSLHPTGAQLDNLTGADVNVQASAMTPLTSDELFADTSVLTGTTTINDFRLANAIQRFQERLARVGSRFTEFLSGVFKVKSRDSRLQRPEYIGGVMKPITISEVLNTTGTIDLPQGNMSGHGATYIRGNESSFFAEEHGYVIIICNIQGKGQYFQGLDREFLKINHPTEIYTPDLANLGEQGTFQQEIFAYTLMASEIFNYNPRWTEHRFINDRVAGLLARDELMHWTAARLFSDDPNFNQDFIENKPLGSSDRIFIDQDPDAENLLVQVYNTVRVVHPIPKLGTPSIF